MRLNRKQGTDIREDCFLQGRLAQLVRALPSHSTRQQAHFFFTNNVLLIAGMFRVARLVPPGGDICLQI